MKIILFGLIAVFATAFAAEPAAKPTTLAESKTTPPTLAEIVANPIYIRGAMGSQAVLVTDPKTGLVDEELAKAVKATGLEDGIHFFPLPATGISPVAKFRSAPRFPDELRRRGVSGEARYLLVIGADGMVKGICCYQSSDPAFAVAGAGALITWKFSPAKIGATPIPVLAAQKMEFNAR
jgi:outer membrane biosynthesis protein TonB